VGIEGLDAEPRARGAVDRDAARRARCRAKRGGRESEGKGDDEAGIRSGVGHLQ